jgi:predicted acyltransferase
MIMNAVPQRVLSVDVLRGLTIALMILVNDPGDWAHVYPQLDHAAWNGFTLTDLVFPNFLFLVGVSLVLSMQSRIARSASGVLDRATRRALALHILRRAGLLFAIKLLLSAFPHFHLTHLRLYGVLTRIALCYLAAGLICLATLRARWLLAIAAALLIGYWALMRLAPVPGFGVPGHGFPVLDPDRNLAAWLDRAVNAFTQRTIHTGSLYNRTRDPEGLLSTLPAIATTLIGALAALWLHRGAELASTSDASGPERPNSEGPPRLAPPGPGTSRGLVVVGLFSLAAGLLWSRWFPINKNLWTSSYVLFSAGWSLLLLALCHYVVDVRRIRQTRAGEWAIFPWLVFGSNAIAAFVLSNFVVEVMLWIKVPGGALVSPVDPGRPITAWLWAYRHLFARTQSTEVTSLAFALAFAARTCPTRRSLRG